MANEKRSIPLPDFDQLNDRVIAQNSTSPTLVIKTNLDPKDVTDDNPYAKNNRHSNDEQFENFFSEK